MSEVMPAKRNPSKAVVLSMFCPGLGHIYCGRFAVGLALSFAGLLPVPVAMAAALWLAPSAGLIAMVLVCLFVLGVYCYAIIDSWRLARRTEEQYDPRDYNRGIVYSLFIVASLIHAPAVVMYIRVNVLEAFYCASNSMAPTLRDGDRFMVNKLWQRTLPERGNLIVFLCPDNREQRYVKRVIAIPGDTVLVQGHEVYVNGRKLEHQPIANADHAPDQSAGAVMDETDGRATYRIQLAADMAKDGSYAETKVPPAHCFVLGDNRDHSKDSRHFGFVPLGDILGKAENIYWPAARWSRFGAIDR